MEPPGIHLAYEGGTLVLTGAAPEQLDQLPGCRLDSRSGVHRAEARHYRAIVELLRHRRLAYRDEARAYQPTPWPLRSSRDPFPHQTEALEAWWQQGGRGVVVLPTGTGKTHLAILAIHRAGRPALVITPTIDLLNQWYHELLLAFDVPVGLVGGGYYDLQPLTATTYDSAYLHLERWGHRFGLIVFDECHHLPGPSYLHAAVGSLAPFRLGLTATPERADGQEILLPELIGPVVYRREIKQLAGEFLAEYRTQRLYVELSPPEQEAYQKAREQYRRFVEERGISMGGPHGWQRFLQETFRSKEGRAAFLAYREQKRLALAAPAKLHLLERLLEQHRRERVLIFTYDNATVYQIARRFLVPAITHQTRIKERRQILERFHKGEYSILVTSQVLNEGVDVPAASVGIILSGTGSVREHVQRLGRLLRKHGDKQALLYEVVTRGTAEEFTSERRRQHHAYH
ncbi:MAG: DEAD/DEAH box helicase family protein [Planctomycetes bacterium]|nr:DEAD/DEAH box helicase family protein [Planctomycetota bacterium]